MGKAGYGGRQSQVLWNRTKHSFVNLGVLSLTVAITAVAPGKVGESNAIAADLPVVESAALGMNLDVPWSEPVRVTDPFEGNFLAVFDRHYFYRQSLGANIRTYVVSLWSPKSVRFLLTDRDRDCLSGPSFYPRLAKHGFYQRFAGYGFYPGSFGRDCVAFNNPKEVIALSIRLGDQVFRLEGKNSVFAVSDELAKALENSLASNIDIRLVTRSGETVDSEIGKGTVEAWKAVY